MKSLVLIILAMTCALSMQACGNQSAAAEPSEIHDVSTSAVWTPTPTQMQTPSPSPSSSSYEIRTRAGLIAGYKYSLPGNVPGWYSWEYKLFFGTWKIEKQLATCAFTDVGKESEREAAKELVGKEITYLAESITYDGTTYDWPFYDIRVLPIIDFPEAEDRYTPRLPSYRELGITGDISCCVEVRWPLDIRRSIIGDEIIIVDDDTLVLYEGYSFYLLKRLEYDESDNPYYHAYEG